MKRFRFAPAVLVALIGLIALVFASSAGAFHTKNPSDFPQLNPGGTNSPAYLGFDPMETSVPYLAWRGEEVRIVKCFDRDTMLEAGFSNVNSEDADGEWQIMDWSGDAHVWPKFFDDVDQRTGHFVGRGDQSGRDCFAIDITSHKPGIAVVKLKIDLDGAGGDVDGAGDPVATHQFTVIWMHFDRAILRCLEADTDVAVSGCPGAGPITENADDTNRLGVLVKGQVPLNAEFRDEVFPANGDPAVAAIRSRPNTLGTTGALLLPDDWAQASRSSLAFISRALRLANNGMLDDDPVQGCPNADTRRARLRVIDSPAEVTDGSRCYTEPVHTAGDFWDIHDSTGPLNTGPPTFGAYAGGPFPNNPLTVADYCPGVEDANHNEDCHVSQNVPEIGGSFDTQFPASNSGDNDCAGDNDPVAGGLNPQPASDAGNGRDTVDNCDIGEWDEFSRVFHDVSGEQNENGAGTFPPDEPTIGPFGHTRPDETMLSDSEVNAHDAPMPAAVVVASIAPFDPSAPSPNVSGVGSLSGVDKHEVYNRGGDDCVNPVNYHCLTGPFSGAYIPPSPTIENNPADVNGNGQGNPLVDDPDTASGIHGSFANNFEGYLPVSYDPPPFNGGPDLPPQRGLYHFWDVIETTRFAAEADLPAECVAQGFRTPTGPQEIVLYTDEHGEAQFQFDAGRGFFEDAFDVEPVQDICEPLDLLGTARITVNARYPFQPVTHSGITSNELVKNIRSLFDKGIICVPKPREENDKALCIVFARDFAGDAITDEIVCVSFEGGGEGGSAADLFFDERFFRRGPKDVCVDLDSPPFDDDIEALLPGPNAGPLCPLPEGDLDEYGTDVILVDLQGGPIEATARFEDENLERNCVFSIPAAGTAAGTGVPNGGGGGGGGVTPNVINPTTALLNGEVLTGANSSNGNLRASIGSSLPSVNGTPAAKRKLAAAKKRASLVFVRLVKPFRQGAVRSVLLRVKSPKKSARIQLRLIGKRGKVLGMVMRTVKTNRTVKVPKLRVPKAALNVRVKLIA